MQYMFPLMNIENLRQAKINISIHTSNSFTDCEKMFIPDFLELDEQLSKYLKEKQEQDEEKENNLLDHFNEVNS